MLCRRSNSTGDRIRFRASFLVGSQNISM